MSESYLLAFLQLTFLKIGLKLPVLGVCWVKNNIVLFMWTQLNSSTKFKIWAEYKCHLEGFKPPDISAFQETFLPPRYRMLQEKSTFLTEVVLLCIKEFNIHSQGMAECNTVFCVSRRTVNWVLNLF